MNVKEKVLVSPWLSNALSGRRCAAEGRAAAEGMFVTVSVRDGRLLGDSRVFVNENVRVDRARVIFVGVVMRCRC